MHDVLVIGGGPGGYAAANHIDTPMQDDGNNTKNGTVPAPNAQFGEVPKAAAEKEPR